jgi:cholesterol 24(S)-hydroxylase
MDLESLIDDFVTFFVAGQETTANTLAFCFLELGKNKDVLLRAREEIEKVLGQKTEISYQDAVDLKYCSCIFKEALRLYPPASGLTRNNLDEMVIEGYKIPKNTIINVIFAN